MPKISKEKDTVKEFSKAQLKQLLAINKAITESKSATELLATIREKVMQLIPFYDTGVLIVERDGLHHYDLAVNIQGWDNSDGSRELYKKGLLKISHPGSYVEFVMNLLEKEQAPLIEDLTLRYDEFDYPFFPVIKELGYKESIVALLKTGEGTFGTFWLNSLQKNHFKEEHLLLFKTVAEQVSVAVANILACEEILKRETEKTQLLQVTKHIAQVQDTQDLLKLIVDDIKPIFNFHDCGLFVLSPDGKTHTDLAAVLPDVSPSEWNKMIANVSMKIPHKNSPIDWMIEKIEASGNPILFDFKDLVEKFPTYPQIDGTGILEIGYRDCLAFNLVSRGKVIGLFCINALEKDFFSYKLFSHFKSVTESICVAIANIIANEELQQKADEISKLNKQLQAQNNYLIEEVEQVYNFEEMIGQNSKFTEVYKSIGLVAKTDSTVLILGETGTGKELVARAIHNNSTRSNKPLIKLNCAALPANLIESELFGHERGAFTGAIDKRIGKFELANGSTLFLDEIGELPIELQAKLLRALQEKEIERLGSNKSISVDVRIIAATNRELEKEVQTGNFRQDLYYRLHIFPITLPSLKERKEDIPLLAAHFLERYSKKIGKRVVGLSSAAMQEMMGYNWPGNVRELEHVIERSVILTNTKLIQNLNLPNIGKSKIINSSSELVIKTWEEQERDYILEILKLTNGKVKGKGSASELLQLAATTLQSKMKKLGIKRKHTSEN